MNSSPEIKVMRLAELKRADYNPRHIGDEQRKALKESLKRFGLVEPLVWNKRTGTLVGGHQRISILEEEGVKETPVVIVDLPLVEEKALNIALNSQEISGQFEFAKLDEQLKELEQDLPDAYDQLRMFALAGQHEDVEIDSDGSDKITGVGDGEHPDMALQPYEHHDYIVLVFRDQRDFMRAMDHFNIQKVDYSFTPKKRIGMGRCIDGAKYIERILKHK